MKYILAISGGVDSCVLLDMVANNLLQGLIPQDVIVAHFDHGMRDESNKDAEFVESLAKKYVFDFVLGKANLGKNASENIAREARYKFLRSIAESNPVKIITAHHQDDLIETITMNLVRGTGWRGLAPMWSGDIERPLLKYSKADIVDYAITNKLEWIEDETNYSAKYLRNRVRNVVYQMDPQIRRKLLEIYDSQAVIRNEIEKLIDDEINFSSENLNKNEIIKLSDEVAIEVLRKWTNHKLTYPQLNKLLNDIKNASGGIDIQPGGGLVITIRKNHLNLKSL